MGIHARSRDYEIIRTYTDTVVTKTTVFDGSNTSESTGLADIVGQHLRRGPKTYGQLIAPVGGGKRFRVPTSYSLSIYDRPTVIESVSDEYYNFDGKLTYRYTNDRPRNPNVSEVDVDSGFKIGGYGIAHDEDALNQSTTQAINKLGGQTAQLGAALAEAKQTFGMLLDTSRVLLSSYRALKRGSLKDAWYFLGGSRRDFLTFKTQANRALAVKFGWLPLMHDLKEGHDWFADNADTPLLVHGTSSSSRTHSGSFTMMDGAHASWSYRSTATTRLTARLRTDFLVKANKGGLLNPASIAWEVTPFSFVLDWWMPIGNIIQTYSDTAGLDFYYGSTSRVSEGSATYRSRPDNVSPYNKVLFRGGPLTDRYYRFDRVVHSGFPWPMPYQKQNWFDASKATTVLALFRQLAR